MQYGGDFAILEDVALENEVLNADEDTPGKLVKVKTPFAASNDATHFVKGYNCCAQ